MSAYDGQLFNAVAVLVGIGLLSLPLAFAYAGWIGSTMMLLGFAWLTCHTYVSSLSDAYVLKVAVLGRSFWQD
jgi:amino acid permease